MVSCEMSKQVYLLINLSVSGELPAQPPVLAPKWLSGQLLRLCFVWLTLHFWFQSRRPLEDACGLHLAPVFHRSLPIMSHLLALLIL